MADGSILLYLPIILFIYLSGRPRYIGTLFEEIKHLTYLYLMVYNSMYYVYCIYYNNNNNSL